MAMYARKKNQAVKDRPKHQYLIDHQIQFQRGHKNSKKLRYTQTPYGAWFLGIIFIATSIFLSYLINTGILEQIIDSGHIPDTSEVLEVAVSYWWRYAIIAVMALLGMLFIGCVDREIISIHHDRMVIQRNNWLLCRRRTFVHDLSHLGDVVILKRGHESYSNSTVHYVLEFRYMDEVRGITRMSILEMNELKEAKKRYVEIMSYLGR